MGLFDSIKNPFEGNNPLDRATSIFEESTALGKGVTFCRLQVCLESAGRGRGSILGTLASKANSASTETAFGLAKLVSDVSLELLRRPDDWVACATEAVTFQGSTAEAKAEQFYNQQVTKELAKFEKEYVPKPGEATAGPATLVVVSLMCAMRGDRTGEAIGGVSGDAGLLRKALQQLAADVAVQRGELLVAAEVLWTPSEDDEVLTKGDLLLDYPELLEL